MQYHPDSWHIAAVRVNSAFIESVEEGPIAARSFPETVCAYAQSEVVPNRISRPPNGMQPRRPKLDAASTIAFNEDNGYADSRLEIVTKINGEFGAGFCCIPRGGVPEADVAMR
jgi:hypothetical protein